MQKVHVGAARASANNVIRFISGAEDMHAKVKHLGEVLSSTKAVGLTRIYLICDERNTTDILCHRTHAVCIQISV